MSACEKIYHEEKIIKIRDHCIANRMMVSTEELISDSASYIQWKWKMPLLEDQELLLI